MPYHRYVHLGLDTRLLSRYVQSLRVFCFDLEVCYIMLVCLYVGARVCVVCGSCVARACVCVCGGGGGVYVFSVVSGRYLVSCVSLCVCVCVCVCVYVYVCRHV